MGGLSSLIFSKNRQWAILTAGETKSAKYGTSCLLIWSLNFYQKNKEVNYGNQSEVVLLHQLDGVVTEKEQLIINPLQFPSWLFLILEMIQKGRSSPRNSTKKTPWKLPNKERIPGNSISFLIIPWKFCMLYFPHP